MGLRFSYLLLGLVVYMFKFKLRKIPSKKAISATSLYQQQFMNVLRDRFYKWNNDRYTFREGIFFPNSVSYWNRCSKVVVEIKDCVNRYKNINILEIGPGMWGGIAKFLEYAQMENVDITLCDINPLAKQTKQKYKFILGDGCRLPFQEDSFDIVVSVDTIEHVPNPLKKYFLNEVKRVAKFKVILHLPLKSKDGMFAGELYDKKVQDWHVEMYGEEEPAIKEHVGYGYPKLEEIIDIFPNAEVKGTINGEILLKCSRSARNPITSLFTGFRYLMNWKKKNSTPPYHSAIIVWNKRV